MCFENNSALITKTGILSNGSNELSSVDILCFLFVCLFVPPTPQGLTRVRSSSDVVGALLRELRVQAGESLEGQREHGALRVAVVVDGVNALWGQTTLKKEDRTAVSQPRF